ncbi:unnamed protein product [Cuscuta epithymum]|uniref:RING-type domain-containing protein n=1 Tax=Cuscuta epithymum TaxID=186058 RepID=A0AAV0DKN9_9ASTE|nr:unnamed protein product [Cuscuta epithymum]
MAVTSEELSRENPIDPSPLLMEGGENCQKEEHIINIERVGDASSSDSSDYETPHGLSPPHHEDRPSSSSTRSNSQSPMVTRRGEGLGRHLSPFNILLWMTIELSFTLGKIIAAIVVLSISRHEKPRTPLFAWVVGYAVGCAASLPLLYWRYHHRGQATGRGPAQGSRRVSSTSDPNSYITFSLTQSSEDEGGHNATDNDEARNARIVAFTSHFKMALDCFFAVWFVVGNVWIFGGHSSSSDAPNLYRLCIVFLTFSCIGYAMPFILCAMICCCLPCIISFLGVREDMNGMRGATEECINALPTYKFRPRKNGENGSGAEGAGFLEAGMDKERSISGEDAVCCICLSNYEEDDEVRELTCSHFFHTECVDKWLRLNASCPLCKCEIGAESENSPSAAEVIQQV